MTRFSLILLLLVLTTSCIPTGKPDKNTENDTGSAEVDTTSQDKVEIETSEFTQSNIKEKLLAYGEENPENKVMIKTSLGNMKIKLYENTPLHRANFIRLAKMEFYDSTIFYRVIKDFMIQGGVNESSDEDIDMLKKKVAVGSYKIPSEINDKNFHRAGAIAMANKSSYSNKKDEKDYKSEPYNFYIVTGKKFTPYQLKRTEEDYGISFSSRQKSVYQSSGGAPHLDNQYTVFGEVISGMSVLRKINNVEVDKYEWPLEEVTIYSVDVID